MDLINTISKRGKDLSGISNFNLASFIYAEHWAKIAQYYGLDILLTIQDNLSANEEYELCADIQKILD